MKDLVIPDRDILEQSALPVENRRRVLPSVSLLDVLYIRTDHFHVSAKICLESGDGHGSFGKYAAPHAS